MSNLIRDKASIIDLDYWSQYTIDEFIELLTEERGKLEKAGWFNIYFEICSRLDPYEDSLGNPEVIFYGQRPKTDTELLNDKRLAKEAKEASKLGLTIQEHKEYMRLKAKVKNDN